MKTRFLRVVGAICFFLGSGSMVMEVVAEPLFPQPLVLGPWFLLKGQHCLCSGRCGERNVEAQDTTAGRRFRCADCKASVSDPATFYRESPTVSSLLIS